VGGWEKIGNIWQKTFPVEGGAELTVMVGQGENFVNGLAFKEGVQSASPEQDRPRMRLEDWIDSLSPEALIQILAKRDRCLEDS